MPNSMKAFVHQPMVGYSPMVAAAQAMHRKQTIRSVDEVNRRRAGFPALAGVGDLDTGIDDSFIYGDYAGGGSTFPDWLQQDFSGPSGVFTDLDQWWNTSGPSTWFSGCSGGVCSGSGSGPVGSSSNPSGGGFNWASILSPLANFGAAFGASQTGMVAVRGANGQVQYVPANSPLALSSGQVGLPAWVYVAGIGLIAYAMLKK